MDVSDMASLLASLGSCAAALATLVHDIPQGNFIIRFQ